MDFKKFVQQLQAAARSRRHYWRHRELIKAKRAAYYQTHREECLARSRNYRNRKRG